MLARGGGHREDLEVGREGVRHSVEKQRAHPCPPGAEADESSGGADAGGLARGVAQRPPVARAGHCQHGGGLTRQRHVEEQLAGVFRRGGGREKPPRARSELRGNRHVLPRAVVQRHARLEADHRGVPIRTLRRHHLGAVRGGNTGDIGALCCLLHDGAHLRNSPRGHRMLPLRQAQYGQAMQK